MYKSFTNQQLHHLKKLLYNIKIQYDTIRDIFVIDAKLSLSFLHFVECTIPTRRYGPFEYNAIWSFRNGIPRISRSNGEYPALFSFFIYIDM